MPAAGVSAQAPSPIPLPGARPQRRSRAGAMAASANAADALARFADADSSSDEGGDGAVAVASGGRGDAAGDKAAAVYAQVEYYFSEANLAGDAFLRKEIAADAGGFVKLSLINSFNRMQRMHLSLERLAAFLRRSATLELDAAGARVRGAFRGEEELAALVLKRKKEELLRKM